MADILRWGYLTRAEAESLDERWRQLVPSRIAWLDHQLLAAGLPDSATVGYADLWSWFLHWPGAADSAADQVGPVWITEDDDEPLSFSAAQAVAADALALAVSRRLEAKHANLVRGMGPKPKGKVPPVSCNEPSLVDARTGNVVLDLAGLAHTCAYELFKVEHGAHRPDLLERYVAAVEADIPETTDSTQGTEAEPWEPPVEVGRAEDDPDYKWTLWIDDVVAHEQEDLVAEFVAALSALKGVSEAHHQDREQILVAGTITKRNLASWVRTWWASNLPVSQP